MSQQPTRTIKIKSSKLYELRMKFERAAVTDFKGVSDSIEQSIEEQYTKTGAFPPAEQLDMLAGILDYVAENIEREALEKEIENRSAAEWRRLEYEHVTKADFTEPDLDDMLLTAVEQGKLTQEQAQEMRSKYKPCAHRFCLNVFMPARKDQTYCCPECRKAESNAVKEYRRTSQLYANGTYLPVYAYKDVRGRQAKQNYETHERLFAPDVLELVGAQKELKKYESSGKRNRKDEERKLKDYRLQKEVKRAESTEPSEVHVTKMTPEEIKKYFANKYTEDHLKRERQRAINAAKAPIKPR